MFFCFFVKEKRMLNVDYVLVTHLFFCLAVSLGEPKHFHISHHQ